MSEAVQWRLDGAAAQLQCGPLSGRVRLDRLAAGFGDKTWQRQPCDRFAVLQIAAPLAETAPQPEPAESYIRGSDLVATWPRVPPATVAPQIYWRAGFDEGMSAARVEVVLSMHTDLLDSRPQSAIHSVGFQCELYHAAELRESAFERLSAGSPDSFDASQSATHLFVLRNDELKLSYAEMVHPGDFDVVQIDTQGAPLGVYRIQSRLFPERLEKGVIRRGRISGWFLPAENDLAAAVELAKRFIDEPLPLTT